MGEGHKLPGGSRDMPPPEILSNEYAMRCNLVHFETQSGRSHIECLDREYFMCTDVVVSG